MKVVLFVAACACLSAASPVDDIKVDQTGYAPDAVKTAVVAAKERAAEFAIRSAGDHKVVLRGKLTDPVDDPDSGDHVQVADFSSLAKAGKYYVDVPGVGRSWDFAIAPNVYSRAYYLAMRSYYGQRCGTAVDLRPQFPGFKHDACHLAGAYHASSGKSGPKISLKGWHDAGDYGRYVVNSGIATAELLWAWEMFSPALSSIKLDLPESGNGVPDILNEIRWNLDWMLSMQDDDGGVWHKQTSERFCGFVMPEKDDFVSYVIGSGKEPFKTTCATADFAAVMAIAARVYKPFDARYSALTLAAAERAWKWAQGHPAEVYGNPKGVSTGAYGDRNCSDELLWASAELWRSTRQEKYELDFTEHYAGFLNSLRPTGPPAWANVGALGLWTYVLGGGKGEGADAIQSAVISAADAIVARTAATPYRVSLVRNEYNWGSNSVVANYGVQLLVANRLHADKRYINTALDNLHYLLGRNALSLSFVTQVGENPVKHPHHRPSGADTNADPWPGLLSGGPNSRRQDPAMRKLPDLPPARMFLDEQESYATNEVAINWNAPLVFLLAGVLPDPPAISPPAVRTGRKQTGSSRATRSSH
jgi:endoglucanase